MKRLKEERNIYLHTNGTFRRFSDFILTIELSLPHERHRRWSVARSELYLASTIRDLLTIKMTGEERVASCCLCEHVSR
jgi:hypothetical protein